MILLLDTSTPLCRLILVGGEQSYESEWQADRGLARGLLAYMSEQLALHGSSYDTLTGLGVLQGPGSFTGLRIGMTVLNTIADAQQIPIVGCLGDTWAEEVIAALRAGRNDRVVLPFYGRDANITTPRK